MLMEQKDRQAAGELARKRAEERVQRERSEKESIMKGKAISATQAMIDRDHMYEDGDIFGEEDIVTLPSTSASVSRTFP